MDTQTTAPLKTTKTRDLVASRVVKIVQKDAAPSVVADDVAACRRGSHFVGAEPELVGNRAAADGSAHAREHNATRV